MTAGIPGLLPFQRDEADKFWMKRDYQHGLQADRESRKQQAVKQDNGRDVTDKEQQQGIPLKGWLIAARLFKMNRNLYFELSKADPSILGIYHLDPSADEGRRHICGMAVEDNPEFEVAVTDATGECVRTIRGWRTVLSKLVRGRFITEAKTFSMFGPPSRDSENWARAI